MMGWLIDTGSTDRVSGLTKLTFDDGLVRRVSEVPVNNLGIRYRLLQPPSPC